MRTRVQKCELEKDGSPDPIANVEIGHARWVQCHFFTNSIPREEVARPHFLIFLDWLMTHTAAVLDRGNGHRERQRGTGSWSGLVRETGIERGREALRVRWVSEIQGRNREQRVIWGSRVTGERPKTALPHHSTGHLSTHSSLQPILWNEE